MNTPAPSKGCKLWTHLLVSGTGQKRLMFRELYATSLRLSLHPSHDKPGQDFYSVEVLRLQRAIRMARDCGCEAREIVPTEGGGP